MDKRGYGRKQLYNNIEDGVQTQIFVCYNSKTDHIGFTTGFHKSAGWNNGTVNNKNCATYLGVTVAEKVLSKVFKNVERMPIHNRGFDFKCSHGYMIDIKASTKMKNRNSWMFRINKNLIADYFLCLAFDNRQQLNLLHIWLISSKRINYLKSLTISESHLDKWNKYELTDKLDKVIGCCNIMRDN